MQLFCTVTSGFSNLSMIFWFSFACRLAGYGTWVMNICTILPFLLQNRSLLNIVAMKKCFLHLDAWRSNFCQRFCSSAVSLTFSGNLTCILAPLLMVFKNQKTWLRFTLCIVYSLYCYLSVVFLSCFNVIRSSVNCDLILS